jgi:vacuolar protein sorting-associated protein 13D
MTNICFSVPCLLDVMQIELVNMDLYAAQREAIHSDKKKPQCGLKLGSFCVNKQGPSLLREKCRLKLQVERNLDTHLSHDGKYLVLNGINVSEQIKCWYHDAAAVYYLVTL